jgi:hypothetical protein
LHPIFHGKRKLRANGADIAKLIAIGQHRRVRRLMLHVINPGPDIDQRFEHGVGGNILHAFAIHPDLAAIADGILILLSGTDHIAISRHARESGHFETSSWRNLLEK